MGNCKKLAAKIKKKKKTEQNVREGKYKQCVAALEMIKLNLIGADGKYQCHEHYLYTADAWLKVMYYGPVRIKINNVSKAKMGHVPVERVG